MDIKQKIGQRIREIRREKGLSQEHLASLCGLDRTYIASIELGKRNVSIINIEKIALALDLSISKLFEGL